MIEPYNPADRYADTTLEAGLLTGLLQAPEALPIISEALTPACFSQDAHRAIYASLAEGADPDVSQLEPTEPPADLAAAAEQIRELAKKRTLSLIAQGARDDLRAGKLADEIRATLEASLLELETEQAPDLFLPIPRVFGGLLEDYRRKQARRQELGNVGLNTHVPGLNRMLGGLQPGIHTLAAPPGTGKTTFTLQLASHVAAEGYPVIFLSFEESLNRLTLKALCQQAGLDLKAFTDGRGDLGELEAAMQEHGPKLARLWVVEGRSGLSVAQVKAKMLQALKEARQRHGLIIVDYLQVWAAAQRESRSDAFRHDVSALIADLRRLSLDLEIPILAISSQSRKAYQGALASDDLASLKESGELEYTADTAWFLINRESHGHSPKVKPLYLSITKNRFGEIGKIPLLFNMAKGIIGEAAEKG